MPSQRDFAATCAAIRFRLDEPSQHHDPEAESQLAAMVARVRSHGLRVTETVTPLVYRCLERVREHLSLEAVPEGYIVNDPSANACAPAFGLEGRHLVILNSGLVELLEGNELDFAIGHELGHLGCRHVKTDEGGHSEFETLQRLARERHAEISADRVGLVAVRAAYTAAAVMLKMGSGLRSDHLKLDVDAFLKQLERPAGERSREWELHASHPGLPLRLWALLRFAESDAYLRCSASPGRGKPLDEVENEIADEVTGLGGGRLSEMESSLARTALAWMGVALIASDRKITRHDRDSLRDVVGRELADKAISFAAEHGLSAVHEKLSHAAERMGAAGEDTREQLRATVAELCATLDLDPESTKAWAIVAPHLGLSVPAGVS
jgi:hypothetical protein